ncbi:hypothetical protein [Azospirillum sp.]|uniref:hypothetical protein n=1 Tax=Azospirillum sp. TaxID=34012 RepID=UPI002D750F68|nr:hypothetical protein [Azospirillum sp.]HYD66456.1 hypothetical protein [Azospirillum sp.]
MPGSIVWTVDDLTEGEGAVLAAVRLWFRSGTARTMPAIRTALSRAGIPGEALLPLFAMLGVLAADSSRAMRVEAPATVRVASDEMAFLEALGAFQHGEDADGMMLLDNWLPLVALCMVSASARDFGRALAGAGVFLPFRRGAAYRPAMAAE